MGQAWHHALPEYLLVKYHRGAIIAGVEGDFSRPSQATLQYELYLLLPVKPHLFPGPAGVEARLPAQSSSGKRPVHDLPPRYETFVPAKSRGLLPVTKKQVFAKKKFRRYEGQLIAILHGICRRVIIVHIRYAQRVQLT